MKPEGLRPCDQCAGKIAPIFYVVRVSMAMVNARAVNALMGTALVLGGSAEALAIARHMSPCEEIATVFGEENPELWHELLLCQKCEMSVGGVPLAAIMAKRAAATARPQEETA
jgi:hypothetical protein